jgi:hypothetical protein
LVDVKWHLTVVSLCISLTFNIILLAIVYLQRRFCSDPLPTVLVSTRFCNRMPETINLWRVWVPGVWSYCLGPMACVTQHGGSTW